MLEFRPPLLVGLWAVYLLLAGPVILVLVYMTPPFQVADEGNHFLRAVQIANGRIIADKLSPTMSGGSIDAQAVDVARAFEDLKFQPDRKLDTALLLQEDGRQWGEAPKIEADFTNTAIYPPFFYLPAAIGIRLGKLFVLSIVETLYLARLLNALCAAALAGAALALCAKGRGVLAVILSFPMVLSLFGSVSQDALSLASGAFVIALWSRFRGRNEDIPTPLRCIAAVLLGAVIAARIPLLPLYVILFLPTSSGRRLFSRAWLARGDVLSIVVGFVPILVGLIGAHAAKVPFRPSDGVSSAAQLMGLIHHPLGAVTLLAATLYDFGVDYLQQMVGVLGWLDTPFPPAYYAWMGFCVAIAIAIECVAPERGLRGKSAALLGCGILLAGLGVFFALYLAWTPVGSPVIDGVQGRYLLVPVMCLIAVLPTFSRTAKATPQRAEAGRIALCVIVGLVNLWMVPITILHRYYG